MFELELNFYHRTSILFIFLHILLCYVKNFVIHCVIRRYPVLRKLKLFCLSKCEVKVTTLCDSSIFKQTMYAYIYVYMHTFIYNIYVGFHKY